MKPYRDTRRARGLAMLADLRQRGVEVLGDERAQDESDDALRAVIVRHGGEERAAIALAKKVLDPLRGVEAAAGPLCEAP